LAKTEIRAGADGLVLERLVEVGDVVQAGRALLLVARSGGIEIVAQVDEKNLQWLQVGQAAEVSPDAFPDARFAATLGFIAPRINPTVFDHRVDNAGQVVGYGDNHRVMGLFLVVE